MNLIISRLIFLIQVTVIYLYGLSPAYARHDCTLFHFTSGASQSFGKTSHQFKGGCQIRFSNGYPIPDPLCTPGAINPQVTEEVLKNPAFGTKCVRNKTTSESKKKKTYRWYGIKRPFHNTGSTQLCELDHLVPLELGGADTLNNIWPECGPDGVSIKKRYFKIKDKVENYLTRQVKQGKINLRDAQEGIANDWTQYIKAAEGS